MKVKDLMEQLKNANPEDEIHFAMNEGCCGDYRDLDLADGEVVEQFPDDTTYTKFRFHALPGYYSCIQAGGTIKAHDEYWKKHGKKEYLVNDQNNSVLAPDKQIEYELHADGVKEKE